MIELLANVSAQVALNIGIALSYTAFVGVGVAFINILMDKNFLSHLVFSFIFSCLSLVNYLVYSMIYTNFGS